MTPPILPGTTVAFELHSRAPLPTRVVGKVAETTERFVVVEHPDGVSAVPREQVQPCP